MKSNIHPTWNHQAKVTCACGAEFFTGSVNDAIQIDICSKCHPFFTGEMKFVDVQGRVDRFLNRQKVAQQAQQGKKAKKTSQDDQTPEETKSLKELLQEEKKRLAADEKAAA